MRNDPLEPAALSFNAEGVPYSNRYRDIYHPRGGALEQARKVFLDGNELPQRWQGRSRFVVLETGFGLGNNFLAAWEAWRADPNRCERLVFLSIEVQPLNRAELAQAHAASALPELAAELQQAWPPLTPDLHLLDFDAGRVRLMLAFGDVQAWLPQLVATIDAFFLDGFAPALNPRMWDERVCRALGRLAAPEATLATWSAAGALRRDLTSAGFDVRRAPGSNGKREITLARFAPTFTPRRAPTRIASTANPERHALIVGAGLAGCATAWALAEQGWRCTVLERQPRVASEASGNPAGLFHGIVNSQDGVHARFNRAAALMAQHAVRVALAQHGIAGAVSGLLRLEREATPAAMQSVLDQLGLPNEYVQAVDTVRASELAGLALPHAAWFYPGGGWVDPAGLSAAWLARAAPLVEVRCGVEVHSLKCLDAAEYGRGRSASADPHRASSAPRWRLLDAAGCTLGEAATVVLANAGDALRLLGDPDWPIEATRGQISVLNGTLDASGSAGNLLPLPRLPIAGSGYLLPALGDGHAMFGATSQRGDHDPAVRAADHQHNLAQLATLLGRPVDIDPHRLSGRTAWRCSTADRLPVIGAVPDEAAAGPRLDQPRFLPRIPGLFVFTALGSRGITWSALGARILASAISGAPMPIEARLVDAVDPARFVSRRARQAARADAINP